jgi:hypothetical protein
MISNTDLLDLHAELERDLLPEFTSTKDPSRLKLEATIVVGFVTTKILLPIICGFLGRLLYDRYKSMQTTSEADQATAEILNYTDFSADVVPIDEIINDMTDKLIEDGVAKERAEQIIARIITAVKQKLHQALDKF